MLTGSYFQTFKEYVKVYLYSFQNVYKAIFLYKSHLKPNPFILNKYTVTPQFSEIGPFKLTENYENENYELCSNWTEKIRKLRGFLRCLDRKLRGMSMIQNTENCENENYELCSKWTEKTRKLRGFLGCLDRKFRGMSMIQNTENCENENYGGENYGVTVYAIFAY